MIKGKVLVTGGGGYIGSVACEMLLEAGYEVVVVDNFSTGYKEPLELLIQKYGKDKICYHTVDIRDDLDSVFKKEKGIKAILHYAAPCSVNESMHDPNKYFSNIICGTNNLLDAASRAGIAYLVYSSSCTTYGEAKYLPIDENHPTNPISPYGQSKLMAEKIIHWYSEIKGLNYVTLRYFNVCGANIDSTLGDSKKPSPHLVQNAVRGVLGIEPFSLVCPKVDTKDGTPVRDYVDVVDLAKAHLLALAYLLKGGENQTINLGTGQGYSVLEIVRSVEQVMGKSIEIGNAATRSGDAASAVASYSKALDILGWKPERSSEDSIKSLEKWYLSHKKGWKS